MKDHSALRLRCLEKLENVSLPSVIDQFTIGEAITSYSGREVSIEAVSKERIGGAAGFLCRSETRDYIYYAAEANSFTRAMILGHEFGHILAKHETTPVSDVLMRIYGAEAVLLLPGYEEHFKARCFQQAPDAHEIEAEAYAHLLIEMTSAATSRVGKTTLSGSMLSHAFGSSTS